jgi:hypothetical protein
LFLHPVGLAREWTQKIKHQILALGSSARLEVFLGKTTLGWTSFSAVQFRSKKWPSTFSGLFKALTVRATHFSIHGRWKIRLGQSGFHKCFIHIKYSVTSANFHFLHETLRREKESVSPWRNLWAQFHMRWKLCGTPLRHK